MSIRRLKILPLLGLISLVGACTENDGVPDRTGATPDAGTTGDGLTTFKVRLENVAPFTLMKSGSFNTKVAGSAPGPLAPGDAFEFTVTAGKGHKLGFAMMFGASNDWVFATPAGGLDLYDANATPLSGDVTSRIALYDVGTEIDEEPAVGLHTGPMQSTSTDGTGAADSNTAVRKLGATVVLTDGRPFTLPAMASMIKATVTPTSATREFKIRIENVSNDAGTLMTSLGPKPVRISPGVWTLSNTGDPLFSEGQSDRGLGLEDIAESGNITRLANALPSLTGLGTPISPGIWVVHQAAGPIFSLGENDRGQGLERIAEEGNIAPLSDSFAASLPAGATATGTFNVPVGKTMPGPAAPGGAYEFDVTGRPGDRLSFLNMFGWSNDWFFGTPDDGIPLFSATGQASQGDFSNRLSLFDAGTELSEEPAVGPNTGPQQPAADTGPVDPDRHVREVSSAVYGTAVARHLKLTITPVN